MLENLGISPDELVKIASYFGDDLDGLRAYVRYRMAEIGDAYEYVD